MKSDVEHYPDPWWARHPVISVIGVVLICVVLSWAGYAFKVAMSPVKGAGDVIIQQNDADNMIKSQKELQKRFEGLPAACDRITIAKEAAAADPDNRILAANYTAAQQHYVTLVAEYNALTQTLLARNMLGDLPARVSSETCMRVN